MLRIYKRKIRYLAFLLFAVALWSCEFNLEEVYINEADENVVPPEIQVVSLNIDKDTIYLYGSKTINFVFSSSNQTIIATKVFFDNNEVLSVSGRSGSFMMSNYNFSTGYHQLTFKVYTGTNSGSIADQLSVEQFELYKTWTVVSFQDFYTQATSSIVNGLLRITWPKCLSNEFKEFEITKNGYFSENMIFTTNKTEFVDSTYLGENRYYSIKAIFQDGTRLDWSSLVMISTSYPQLYFSSDDQNQSILKWRRSKYYNAIDSVVVYKEVSYGNYEVVKTSHDPNDTICIVPNLMFHTDVSFKVDIVSREFKQNPASTSYNQSIPLYNAMVGYKFLQGSYDYIWDFKQVSESEVVYVTFSDSVMRYSVDQKAVISRLYAYNNGFSPMYFSPDGKYLTAYINSTNNLLLVNTSNFQSNKVLDLTSLSGTYYYPYMPVSNNGNIITSSINNGIYLYNLLTETTIAHYYNPTNYYQNSTLKISSEGDYLLIQDDSLRLIKYAYGGFTTVHADRFFTEYKFFEFHPSEKDRFIYWDGSTFSVRSSDDYSIISSFPLTDTGIFNIDYLNNRLLSYIQGHLYVRDLATGDILYDIPINSMVSEWYREFYLTGNMILSRNGVAYFII